MPLYEYECEACGGRFERIHQKFSDPPVTVCPKCGGAVRKLLSSPAIQFKGSGFYITDYAKAGSDAGSDTEGKGDKKPAEATASSSGDSPAGGSGTDLKSKPAAAPETKSSESPKKTEPAKT